MLFAEILPRVLKVKRDNYFTEIIILKGNGMFLWRIWHVAPLKNCLFEMILWEATTYLIEKEKRENFSSRQTNIVASSKNIFPQKNLWTENVGVLLIWLFYYTFHIWWNVFSCKPLPLSRLIQQTTNWLNFSNFPQETGYDISWKRSPIVIISMKYQILFSGKISKIFQYVVCWKLYPEC